MNERDVLEQWYVRDGLTIRAIAKRCGASHQWVFRKLKEHKIPRRGDCLTGSRRLTLNPSTGVVEVAG